MKEENFQNKIIKATKWSSITEVSAKLVSPVTNIILVRILTPEAFGVVATITMIVSFADMLSDSGFQKYLVQHEFKHNQEKYQYANVAFWSNFVISIIICFVIVAFCEQIATMVGNPGLGEVLAIACLQLPLTSFSSIQVALYRREFDFKTLFYVRIVAIAIPFVVTIPVALLGLDYWALIIGNLMIQFSNAVILTIKSKWKPNFFYSFIILKKMFTFSMWTLIEAISIWLTAWIDSFIIGSVLNQYYLGIYKTSTTMVNGLMVLVTAAVVPVLFSALSRLQSDDIQFKYIYFKFQRFVSILVFPLGVGVYLYSDLATKILLGSQWSEAQEVIGIWALTSSIMIVFGHFCSEAYRAKGLPRLSFISQLLHLVVLVPVCIISSKYGFWTLVYSRAFVRLQFVIVHFVIMRYAIGISIIKTFLNVMPMGISAITMGIFGYILRNLGQGVIWDGISIFFCILVYFAILFSFPNNKKEIIKVIKHFIPNKYFREFMMKYN